MRGDTKKRKKATQAMKAAQEQRWWADQVMRVMVGGKQALDAAMLEIGRLTAETIMYIDVARHLQVGESARVDLCRRPEDRSRAPSAAQP